MSTPEKVKIRTSSLPRQLPSNQPLPSEIHNALSTALLDSKSIPNIEKVLSQSLAESGWTTELRNYIQRLVRSGECTTYNEILKKVMEGVTTDGNGEAPVEELRIPEQVVRKGVKVVRKELEKCVVVVVDD